jgi:hypothetical protein
MAQEHDPRQHRRRTQAEKEAARLVAAGRIEAMTQLQERDARQQRRRTQAQKDGDIVGLRRSHRDLQRSQDNMRTEMHARFDTLEARMETMIEEMRRFFGRYEHIDPERSPTQ